MRCQVVTFTTFTHTGNTVFAISNFLKWHHVELKTFNVLSGEARLQHVAINSCHLAYVAETRAVLAAPTVANLTTLYRLSHKRVYCSHKST